MRFLPILLAAALTAAAPARADDGLDLILDWFINPDHAPLVIAETEGFFADEGVSVRLIEPADPNTPPKLVAAGQADLAVSYQPALQIQVAEGLPLVRVATLVATPLNSLVALEDGPIRTLADLKGRTVGFSVGGFEDAVLGAMLRDAGLDLDDVKLVNVNFALSGSLMSGQVDAVIGAFRNFELNQLDIEERPGRAFFPEDHGVPVYDELVIVAAQDRADDPRIAAVVRAISKGVQYVVNRPERSWEAFIAAYPQADDELNRRAWTDTLPRFALRPAAVDAARYETFGRFLIDSGLVEALPPADDYLTVPR